jgi:hypothetical protein
LTSFLAGVAEALLSVYSLTSEGEPEPIGAARGGLPCVRIPTAFYRSAPHEHGSTAACRPDNTGREIPASWLIPKNISLPLSSLGLAETQRTLLLHNYSGPRCALKGSADGCHPLLGPSKVLLMGVILYCAHRYTGMGGTGSAGVSFPKEVWSTPLLSNGARFRPKKLG